MTVKVLIDARSLMIFSKIFGQNVEENNKDQQKKTHMESLLCSRDIHP